MIKFNKIQSNDKDYFLELNNDPDTVRQMEHLHIFTENDFNYLVKTKTNSEWYIVRDTRIEQDVGLFTVYMKNNKIYLGVIIDPHFRRQGYAKSTFTEYLNMTDKAGYDTYLGVFISNPAIKLYKQLGYKQLPGYKTIDKRKFVTMVRRAKNT